MEEVKRSGERQKEKRGRGKGREMTCEHHCHALHMLAKATLDSIRGSFVSP
jgi:hypothetical protein